MRVPTLKPKTRTGLLAVGLFLIGLSTAVGLVAPESESASWNLARSHADGAPADEGCHAPG